MDKDRESLKSFACKWFSCSLILILAKRSSRCSAFEVWIRGLEKKPSGINFASEHLVRNLMCALTIPIRLYIELSSPDIPLQDIIQKKNKLW